MENVSTVDSGAKTETPLQQIIDSSLPPSTALAAAVETVQRKRVRTVKPAAATVETPKPSATAARVLSDAEKQIARETVKALTHTLDFAALVYIGGIANECGLSEDEIKRTKERVVMTPQMRDGVTTSGVAVAEKYGIASSLPELALGGYLVAYVGGLVALAREMKAEFKPKQDALQLKKDLSTNVARYASEVKSDGPRKGEPRA